MLWASVKIKIVIGESATGLLRMLPFAKLGDNFSFFLWVLNLQPLKKHFHYQTLKHAPVNSFPFYQILLNFVERRNCGILLKKLVKLFWFLQFCGRFSLAIKGFQLKYFGVNCKFSQYLTLQLNFCQLLRHIKNPTLPRRIFSVNLMCLFFILNSLKSK